jgi:hypothetical protein
LAVSTSKKVVVQRFDRESLEGFVNPSAWLTPAGIELLTVAGLLNIIPYSEARAVFFVREFGPDPAAAMRRAFLSRPKLTGLWVRLLFREIDVLESFVLN